MSVDWCSIVFLTCVFWMTNDVEQLFMCLFASCMSSAVMYQFKSLCPFKLFIAFFFSIVEFREFFIFSGDKSFVRFVIWKYFLLVYSWSFYSLNSVFSRSCLKFRNPVYHLFIGYVFGEVRAGFIRRALSCRSSLFPVLTRRTRLFLQLFLSSFSGWWPLLRRKNKHPENSLPGHPLNPKIPGQSSLCALTSQSADIYP